MTRPGSPLLLLLLVACGGGDRERELADCVAIQQTTYVSGEVSDCLVRRYGWKADEAAKVERERLGGRIGDSASP